MNFNYFNGCSVLMRIILAGVLFLTPVMALPPKKERLAEEILLEMQKIEPAKDIELVDFISYVSNHYLSVFSTEEISRYGHYHLIYRSQSKTPADMDHPRILMNQTDRTHFNHLQTWAFTTHSAPHANGQEERLEILDFNSTTQEMEIYYIDFKYKPPRRSETNPKECTACHGEQPRPFWDGYNLWPGFRGSAPDFSDGERVPTKNPPLFDALRSSGALEY